MTDFGKSAKGPTLTDLTSVASNATNINTVATNMQDVQDVATEINASPTLRSLMNSVLNDTITLDGLTDTTIGTLTQSNDAEVLTWVWDTNTSTGSWEPAAVSAGSNVTQLSDLDVTDPTINGYGLKYTGSAYIAANFAEIGVDYTVPTGANQLAVSNGSGTFEFASTISGDYTFQNNITISGNLNVTGTTTTINTQDLNVVDATITVADGSTSNATANGAGIEFGGHTGAATFLYDGNNDQFGIDRKLVEKGDGSAAAGAIQYNCWNNNHYVILEGPVHDANGDNTVLRLPNTAPASAGQVLSVKSTNTANGVTTAELEFASGSGASTGFAIAMAIVF